MDLTANTCTVYYTYAISDEHMLIIADSIRISLPNTSATIIDLDNKVRMYSNYAHVILFHRAHGKGIEFDPTGCPTEIVIVQISMWCSL